MKNERQTKILEYLSEREWATVGDLSRHVYASMPTIRRDLAFLSRQGLIKRTHGGASILKDNHFPFDFRAGLERGVKREMCRAASTLIRDGMCIFIDGSTSCRLIAEYLSDFERLTVVTNSAVIPAVLSEQDITVHATGGVLQPRSLCCAGRKAEEFVQDFRFDILFFSSHSLAPDGAVTDYSYEETSLRKVLLGLSKRKVLLCDSSKIGSHSACYLTNLSEIDTLITDSREPFEIEVLRV